MTSTSVYGAFKTALTGAGVHAVYGPAEDLPLTDGRIAQAAVLYPSAALHQYTRACGRSSGREHRVVVICVGASTFDALAVADRVEAAVGGMRVSAGGGTWQQVASSGDPAVEPNADPTRVSVAVQYSAISKG